MYVYISIVMITGIMILSHHVRTRILILFIIRASYVPVNIARMVKYELVHHTIMDNANCERIGIQSMFPVSIRIQMYSSFSHG